MEKQKTYLYVSQWAHIMGEPGMSLYTFDTESGAVEKVAQLDSERGYGCAMIDEERHLLYVCYESDVFPQTPYNTGRVYCFKIDPQTGLLTENGYADTLCPFTCYINTDPEKRYLLVANHSMHVFATHAEKDAQGRIHPVTTHHDSLVNLFALREDGTIGEMLDFKKHERAGEFALTLMGRPAIAHPHCMMRSPDGTKYAVCDKGDGQLYLYGIDEEKRELKLLERAMSCDTLESEPRYCMFHPEKPLIYVNHEHTPDNRATVTTFRYDEAGHLEKVDTLRMNTPLEGVINQQQGMCISADGRFIYTQVQGSNLLMVLETDDKTGLPREKQAVKIRSEWPRCLTLSPDGRFLIQCSLDGAMNVYAVDADGTLTETEHGANIPGGTCVRFYQPKI